jgi:nickel transport protein
MMKRWQFSIYETLVFLALMVPFQVLAHGVEGSVQPGGLAVSCRYSTGEPMSFAKVAVLSPGTSQPFQVGNADKNGRFCFYPDAVGEWRLTADDNMGHRLEVKAPVTDLNSLQTMAPTAPGGSGAETRSLRVLTGLSAIFAVSGLLFWWQGLRFKRDRQKC